MCNSYTCITCRVAFKDVEFQRLHYKTDWHRYNLKRKVVDLPPVTSEDFEKRVLQQRQKDTIEIGDKNVYCKACRKNFNSANSYKNHLNSKVHKLNEEASSHLENDEEEIETQKVKLELTPLKIRETIPKSTDMDVDTDSEVEEVDSDEWELYTENPIDNNDCLFCSHHSQSMSKNLAHMSLKHSFFIPDVEYCIDLRGLLAYLGEKIMEGYMCIWCNDKGRTFHSSDAAKSHMLDKGHCKMLHEGVALAEYADYYDYTSSYPDAEENELAALDGSSENCDEEVNVDVLDGSDFQLVLPSGITVGHRSLLRYYKQSIDPNRQQAVMPTQKKLHKVLAQYRSLGWTATQQEQAARKARDIHYMRRLQSKWNTKLGINANKLQKHFRVQCNF